MVSVPLSGLVSVNGDTIEYEAGFMTGFRPLIGVSFCKPGTGVSYSKNVPVSVPLSGLVSVNDVRRVPKPITDSFRPLIGVSFCKQKSYIKA